MQKHHPLSHTPLTLIETSQHTYTLRLPMFGRPFSDFGVCTGDCRGVLEPDGESESDDDEESRTSRRDWVDSCNGYGKDPSSRKCYRCEWWVLAHIVSLRMVLILRWAPLWKAIAKPQSCRVAVEELYVVKQLDTYL